MWIHMCFEIFTNVAWRNKSSEKFVSSIVCDVLYFGRNTEYPQVIFDFDTKFYFLFLIL